MSKELSWEKPKPFAKKTASLLHVYRTKIQNRYIYQTFAWESLYLTGVQYLQNKGIFHCLNLFLFFIQYPSATVTVNRYLQINWYSENKNMLFKPAAYDIHILTFSEANNKTRFLNKSLRVLKYKVLILK